MIQSHFETPLGVASITETDGFISAIHILDEKPSELMSKPSPVIDIALQQLKEYFAGERKTFNFAMKQSGTDFQQLVWAELCNIGYGDTMSYARLSDVMKNPLAIRAIAAANGKNNLWIVVPCHRVIGSNGELTGYAGGLWRKKWLLDHEAKISGKGQTSLAF